MIDTQADCSIDNVLKVGSGYLATSWLFFKETVGQHDPKLVYAFGFFSLLVQIAFARVMSTQRDARCKFLGLPTKGVLRASRGDVVVEILNWLLILVAVCLSLFLLLAIIAILPGIKINPVPFL